MAGGQQPVSSVTTNTNLPAAFRTLSHTLELPSADINSFLATDLAVTRIDEIEEHLWTVGRPYLPRCLSLQQVLERTIVPTTDASLHLVWTPGRIFIKALPAYLLSNAFYDQQISGSAHHGSALGLLYSYAALVPTELEFALAKQADLIPGGEGYSWSEWKAQVARTLAEYEIQSNRDKIPKRYKYGELRLARLNKIYRLKNNEWLYGYSRLFGAQTYASFISEHTVVITTATVYLVVVLTAMQLGLSTTTNALIENATFQRVCYGFAIFAILSPVIAAGLVMIAAAFLFFVNWFRTDRHNKSVAEQKPLIVKGQPGGVV